MIGWLIAIGLALLLIAALVVARLPRAAWEITAAAVLLGLAGYAWQGHPGLAGNPRAVPDTPAAAFDEAMVEKRRGLAERYGKAGQWLIISDGLARQGQTQDAANVLLSGLRAMPNDSSLWLGLGNALVAHGGGILSPSADFAFQRALALDPEGPAPRYFYGLALARGGSLREARALWAPLVARAPDGSEVKAELQANIARLDAMLAGPVPPEP